MVELLHPDAVAPTAIFDRLPGALELHDLRAREAAAIVVAVSRSEVQPTIRAALGEVARRVDEAGVPLGGPPFVRYLSSDPAGLVAQVGFPVLRPAPKIGRVDQITLPGGLVASMVHVGPYENLGATYRDLHEAIERAGLHEAGPPVEVYWSDPKAEPDPSTWRTELVIPVA